MALIERVIVFGRRVSDDLSPSDAERRLGAALPPDYAEWVARFGRGEVAGYLRVFTPSDVIEQTLRFRKEWLWVWDADEPSVAAEESVRAGLVVAETIDGDVAATDAAGGLYLLPRHDSSVVKVERTIEAAIERLVFGGAPFMKEEGAALIFETDTFLASSFAGGWSGGHRLLDAHFTAERQDGMDVLTLGRATADAVSELFARGEVTGTIRVQGPVASLDFEPAASADLQRDGDRWVFYWGEAVRKALAKKNFAKAFSHCARIVIV